jgi:hypothetical protein
MGILKWVDYTLSEPSFFKLMTDSTPLHLALLDEVYGIFYLQSGWLKFIYECCSIFFLDKHVPSFTTFASIVTIGQNI